jgi:hypothetical protein
MTARPGSLPHPVAALASLAALAVAAGVAAAGSAVLPAEPTADTRLHRAHIAAASAHLRLLEAGVARTWLEEAPPAPRHWEWRFLAGGYLVLETAPIDPGRRRRP